MALNYNSPKPRDNFIMIENEAMELSPNAYYLYILLRNIDKDATNSNEVLAKRAKLNMHAYKKAKAELIEKKWLATQQLYGNRYAFYIGKIAVKRYNDRLKKWKNKHKS